MARYVDGYVLPVPKKNLTAYRRLAQKAGKIWREHGALDYKECAGDDLNIKMGVPSPAPDEGPARRDDRIRLHSLQVACASGQRQRQGHERSTHCGTWAIQRTCRSIISAWSTEASRFWSMSKELSQQWYG